MSVARSFEAREMEIRRFLSSLYGGEYADLRFTVVVATRLPDGELDWKNRRTLYLRMTDDNVAKLVQASDKPGREVFFTPVPRSAKGDPSAANAGTPRTVYADVDKNALPARTLAWLRGLGACLVRSGGVVLTEAGKEVPRYHVHLPLDAGSATPAHHEVEQINQALTKRLGGDSKTSVGVILRLPGTRNWKPENRDADGIGRLVSVETYASHRVSIPDAASALRAELLSASEYQRASVAVESAVSAAETFERYPIARPLLRKANQMFQATNYDARHKLAGGLTRDLWKRGLTEAEALGVMLGHGIEDTPNPGCLAAQDKWTDAQIAVDVARVYVKATEGEQSGPLGKADRPDESSPTRQNEKGRSLMSKTSADPAASESRFGVDYWDQQAKLLDVSEGEIRHLHLARFVADHCGHGLRYVTDVGWFKWNGTVWAATGDDGAAYQAINEAQHILMCHGAEDKGDAGWCSQVANKLTVHYVRKAIVAEMAVLPELHTDVNVMDTKRHLLTFRNGTVDLRSGELVPHRPEHMLTQCADIDYKPEAECPRWLRFVDEIFPGDAELQGYYQTFLGYCITGETREHILGVFYGDKGRNGKGTTVRTLQKIFGTSIIRSVDFSMYEKAGSHKPHTEEIAALRSARMVVAQEGNPGTRMNTAMLKNHSGGDLIQARHLRRGVFQLDPKFTLVLVTNNLPKFPQSDTALWARTKAIHFGVSFAGRTDPELEPTIQGEEAEGVAAWIVRGAVRYYAEGLRDAESVTEATEQYREGSDALLPLLGEVFEYAEGEWVKQSEFNRVLKMWREDNDVKGFTPISVKRTFQEQGRVEPKRDSSGNQGFLGIKLMDYIPSQRQTSRDVRVVLEPAEDGMEEL